MKIHPALTEKQCDAIISKLLEIQEEVYWEMARDAKAVLFELMYLVAIHERDIVMHRQGHICYWLIKLHELFELMEPAIDNSPEE